MEGLLYYQQAKIIHPLSSVKYLTRFLFLKEQFYLLLTVLGDRCCSNSLVAAN